MPVPYFTSLISMEKVSPPRGGKFRLGKEISMGVLLAAASIGTLTLPVGEESVGYKVEVLWKKLR